jgi:antitoxin component YwqK of YwqJK toxin-antitoxin module
MLGTFKISLFYLFPCKAPNSRDKIGQNVKYLKEEGIMRILSLLAVALFFLAACQRVESRKEKYPSGKLKAKYEVTSSKEGELKNGVYEEYYENGKMKCIVNYVDDKKHGVYRSYHESGKMEAEIYFLNGLKSGDYKEWYDNGNKKCFAEYKADQLNGTIRTWENDGAVVAKASFKSGVCKSGDCNKVSPGTAKNFNVN